MSLKSRLGMESMGLFAAYIFYAIAGIFCFALLAIIDFRLVHIGIIGILSLMTSYALFRKRVWAVWLVVALFFIVTTFSVYSLYFLGRDLIVSVGLVAYLLLTWLFTIYTVARRKNFET